MEQNEQSQHPLIPRLVYEDYLTQSSGIGNASIKAASSAIWASFLGVSILLLVVGLAESFRAAEPLVGLATGVSFAYALFWIGFTMSLMAARHFYKINRPIRSLDYFYEHEADRSSVINVADYLHPEARKLLVRLFKSAAVDTNTPINVQFFLGVSHQPLTQRLFDHLELDSVSFLERLNTKISSHTFSVRTEEDQKRDFLHLVFNAFIEAVEAHSKSIRQIHLFLAGVETMDPVIRDTFLGSDLDEEDVRNVVKWLQMKIDIQPKKAKNIQTIKHRTVNRAWTSKPTPLLDAFSTDLTDLARAGVIGYLVGHEPELTSTLNILSQSANNNALLIGQAGSGRNTIIQHIALLVARDRIPASLKDRRLVSLDAGAMLAGVKSAGDLQGRMTNIMTEITSSKNIILAIPQIHDLIRAADEQSLSFMSFFGPIFQSIDFPIISSTDPANYHKYIEPQGELAGSFSQVSVEEISPDIAVKLLLSLSIQKEYQEGMMMSYFAIKEAVSLSDRFIHTKPLPGKALDLIGEALQSAKNAGKKLVTREDVRKVISQKSGVSVTQVSEDESEELLGLEEKIHERMVNQVQAVSAVSEALRQARSGVSRLSGPTGVFMFVGPTGVGKTELAKTLAELYFKGEENMIRIDMSEFQERDSLYRLIGKDGNGGLLTEAVKQKPFSIVLLDEFEKAHRDIINVFLQVFDDGRVTDELGNVVDFRNSIIVATSNAHSVYITESIEKGIDQDMLQKELREKLTDVFKPELLNRFDEIIVFRSLNTDEIKEVTRRSLKKFVFQVEERHGIRFTFNDSAISQLATEGYDPVFGARPVRRVIRKRIRSLVANELLKKSIKKGEKYEILFVEGVFKIKPVVPTPHQAASANA